MLHFLARTVDAVSTDVRALVTLVQNKAPDLFSAANQRGLTPAQEAKDPGMRQLLGGEKEDSKEKDGADQKKDKKDTCEIS